MKRVKIHKIGTAKYYKDQIDNIRMVLIDYDGMNTKKASNMRNLLIDIKDMAEKALSHKVLYYGESHK